MDRWLQTCERFRQGKRGEKTPRKENTRGLVRGWRGDPVGAGTGISRGAAESRPGALAGRWQGVTVSHSHESPQAEITTLFSR